MSEETIDFEMSSLITPIGPLAEQKLPQISGPAEVPTVYTPVDQDKVEPTATRQFVFDSRPLDVCIQQAENLRDLLHSDAMALKVIGILSYGLRRSGELESEAIYQYKMAKSDRRRAEARAALEGFGRYVSEQKAAGIDVKVTDTTRSHYVAIDPDVLQAVEREAFYEALVSRLDTYKTQFTMTLSAIKAIISKNHVDQISSLDPGIVPDPYRSKS